MATSISSQVFANWVSRLVQIPSVTPSQAGGFSSMSGENAIARRVGEWFKGFGGRSLP